MSPVWKLPKDLLARSIEIMAPHGKLGNEGLALWFGAELNNEIKVTHVVEIRGPGLKTSPLNLQISMRGMSMLTDLAEKYNRYLVGQIHSHPGNFIDLSAVDKEYGIRIQDYLSIVCPHYAQSPSTTWSQCGTHVFEDRSYRRLKEWEIQRRILLTAEAVNHLTLEIPS